MVARGLRLALRPQPIHSTESAVEVRDSSRLERLRIFVYTGPSFDIGVGGKFKQSAEAMGESVATEESIYDPEYGFKRFNMLWGVGAGVRWKFLQLRIGGDWGLLNINRLDEKVTLSKPGTAARERFKTLSSLTIKDLAL